LLITDVASILVMMGLATALFYSIWMLYPLCLALDSLDNSSPDVFVLGNSDLQRGPKKALHGLKMELAMVLVALS
jgi:hypothetical protein